VGIKLSGLILLGAPLTTRSGCHEPNPQAVSACGLPSLTRDTAPLARGQSEDVHLTLRIMGVEGVNKIAAADLRSVVAMQPKPRVRGARREAQDKWQEGWDRFHRRYPDAMRIRLT
jgi:hypothetical protein